MVDGKVRRVYLSGPMRGLPNWNHVAFQEAEQRWHAAGYIPFSPAAVAQALGYTHGCDSGEPEDARDHLEHVIQLDLACIHAADAIALLPGWERSRGVTVELSLAQFLGLPIFDAVTMQRIYPPQTPWYRWTLNEDNEVDHGDWSDEHLTEVAEVQQQEQQANDDWYSSRSAIWAEHYKSKHGGK